MKTVYWAFAFVAASFLGFSVARAAGEISTKIPAMPKSSSNVGFRLTPVAGYGALASTDSNNGSANKTFEGGLLVDVGTKRRFTFSTGLLYFESGSTVTSSAVSATPGATSTTTDKISLQYLGVPLLVKANFHNTSDYTTSLKLGMMPAALVGSTSIYDNQSALGDVPLGQTPTGELSPTGYDVLGVAGITLTLPFLESLQYPIIVDASYMRGAISTQIRGVSSYNEGFLVSLGVGFDL